MCIWNYLQIDYVSLLIANMPIAKLYLGRRYAQWYLVKYFESHLAARYQAEKISLKVTNHFG